MKKTPAEMFLILLSVSLALTTTSRATQTFQWLTGAVNGGQGSVELPGDVLYPANYLVFGFYTADTSIDFDPNTGSYGTDVFLGTISSGPTAGRIAGTPLSTTNPSLSPGYAYMVAFNIPYNASYNPANMPAGGTAYGISVLSDYNGTAPYSETFSDRILYNSNTLILNSTIVPEPSTMALLACGMGVMVMRRRRKQE
jgi:hypothetical protein